MVTHHYHSCAQEHEAGGTVSLGPVQATWTDPAFTVKLTQSSLLLGYYYKREDPKDGNANVEGVWSLHMEQNSVSCHLPTPIRP